MDIRAADFVSVAIEHAPMVVKEPLPFYLVALGVHGLVSFVPGVSRLFL